MTTVPIPTAPERRKKPSALIVPHSGDDDSD